MPFFCSKHWLLFVLVGIINWMPCSTLDTRWQKWFNESSQHSHNELDFAKCSTNDCVNQALDFLNEIHQDLTYANKTINIDRVSAKLIQRLGDMESAYDEYSIASQDARNSLNNSINIILTQCNRLNASTVSTTPLNLTSVVDQSIVTLEVNASKLSTEVDSQAAALREIVQRQASLKPKLKLLQDRHQGLMDDVSVCKAELDRVIELHQSRLESSSSVEHQAGQLEEDNLEQANKIVTGEQFSANETIVKFNHDLQVRAHQLISLWRRFGDLARDGSSRAAQLIAARIVNGDERHYHYQQHLLMPALNNDQLETQLREALNRSKVCLERSRDTLDFFGDLQRSISFGDDEGRLLLADSRKDVRDTGEQVANLTAGLNSSRNQVIEWAEQLVRLDSPIHLEAAKLNQSIQELALRNRIVSKWTTDELATGKKELARADLVKPVTNESVIRAQNWTQIISIGRTVEHLTEKLRNITESISRIQDVLNANINADLMQRVQQFNSSQILRNSSLSLLNTTKYLTDVKASELIVRLSKLNDMIAISSHDLEQTNSHLTETNQILQQLQARNETHNHLDQINSEIEIVSKNSSLTTTRNSSLKGPENDQLSSKSMTNLGIQHRKHDNDLENASSIDIEHDFYVKSTNYDDIARSQLAPVNQKFAILQERLTNLTAMGNLTQTASIRMRHDIESLSDKIEHAHFLIDRLKLRPFNTEAISKAAPLMAKRREATTVAVAT
jgi:hypothetical protein